MAAGCQLGLNAALTVNLPAGEFALMVEPWAPAEPEEGGVYTVNITCRAGTYHHLRREPRKCPYPLMMSPGALSKEAVDSCLACPSL